MLNHTQTNAHQTIPFNVYQLSSDIDDLTCASDMLSDIGNSLGVIAEMDNIKVIQSLARLAQFNAESGANFSDNALANIRSAILSLSVNHGNYEAKIITLNAEQLTQDINDLSHASEILKEIGKTLNSMAQCDTDSLMAIHSLAKLAQSHINIGVTFSRNALDSFAKAMNDKTADKAINNQQSMPANVIKDNCDNDGNDTDGRDNKQEAE